MLGIAQKALKFPKKYPIREVRKKDAFLPRLRKFAKKSLTPPWESQGKKFDPPNEEVGEEKYDPPNDLVKKTLTPPMIL